MKTKNLILIASLVKHLGLYDTNGFRSRGFCAIKSISPNGFRPVGRATDPLLVTLLCGALWTVGTRAVAHDVAFFTDSTY
jgi:hypothetical protein